MIDLTQTNTASALVWALSCAREYGGATAALAATGIDLPRFDRLGGTSEDFDDLVGRSDGMAVRDAFALGVLAGRVAHRPARRRGLADPTSFLLDGELVVQAAQGESILRLPWFEEGLFVGRRLSDISEMPKPVRRLCIENYTTALAGDRARFAFVSCGHAYTVDAVPVWGEHGQVDAVLAVATPAPRQGSERARASAQRLRSGVAGPGADPPALTPRQTEILTLASHGLTAAEMARQLTVSISTVKTHFDNIYRRFGVSDRAAAVATALRHGLIE